MAQNQRLSAKEFQKNFAESLSCNDELIWDLVPENQPDLLKKKLKELIPDHQTRSKKTQDAVFTSLWNQRKYTNGQSLTAIIYVVVVPEEKNFENAEISTNFSYHPVIRARRCIYGTSSSHCCNLFVDENARVYQNWGHYVATNKLPPGTMVAPKSGIYKLVEGEVSLEKFVTPAGSAGRKALHVLDTSVAIGGFASAGVSIVAATCVFPFAAPLMGIAGLVGLGTATYATTRSSIRLADRSKHEQSIKLTDREARGHWLNTMAGVVGIGAAGVTKAVGLATIAGKEVGKVAQMTVNGVNITSIAVSGSSVANGVVDIIIKAMDGEDITAMDVLQLSASLVLFTHSIHNFKLASTIIREAANGKIDGFRKTLSESQRISFDKYLETTVSIRGETKGILDIIRCINDTPSHHELRSLFMSPKGVKNTVNISCSNLKLGLLLTECIVTIGKTSFNLKDYGEAILKNVVNAESFENIVRVVAESVVPNVFNLIMNMTETFLNLMLKELTELLKFFISTESVLFRMMETVLNDYREKSYQFIEAHTLPIMEKIKRQFLSLNPSNYIIPRKKCEVCDGYYTICPL
ncbi:uncharacterized protein Dana_GF18460 [Drosophila ananassae]|uniref:DUF4781 domain-containing protein n=1 Tax=Drosophila ananassae TaxID=7217 RepID=B3M256_DROAN|nr:uncharacterized protein LOC6501234 [Drosophila ananassae]EDV43380.1 uncharacterized protein Dana_GF18460 [Drosophila ananassae]